MNKPIRVMAVFSLVLVMALLLNVTYVQFVKAGDLNDDPGNRRVTEAAFSRDRGAILVGREPIAKSTKSNDKYKYQRVYPTPFKYSHVTGFFSYYSQTGLERSQNQLLSGEDSRLFVNRIVDLATNSEPQGGSVELTLRRKAQNAAFEGLSALGEGVEGAVVALEPETGRILAMVSKPSFNPNRMATHDLAKAARAYEQLEGKKSQPLLNRAIQTTLPPGSTFKLVTAAAALENRDLTPESEVPGGDSYKPKGTTKVITNGGRSCGSSTTTFTLAMQNSCNTSFAQLANEVGSENMKEQAEKFGFNETYLEDLPQQAASRYPSVDEESFNALMGIGQYEVAATPLQMAVVAAGIANGGSVMRPFIVQRLNAGVDALDTTEPEELSTATSPGTAQAITDMMVATVSTGTATAAQIPGVDVAGKTGTAQSTEERPPYAWFVSFAPANDPEVAVAVLVESSNTDRSEIAGGALGGPIAKAIMEAVIND